MLARCGGRVFGVPAAFPPLDYTERNARLRPDRKSGSIGTGLAAHGGMRETFLPGHCDGCGEPAWLVEVEQIRLAGAWHRLEIWFPHAACGRGRSFDHAVVVDRASFNAGPEPAGSRTTSSRRRA
jgi:hypothetical protein